MEETDSEQKLMESNGVNQQSGKVKVLKLVTTLSIVAFVITIAVASGFLVHQSNQHRDLIQERDEKVTELQERLQQLEEAQAAERASHDEERARFVRQEQELTTRAGDAERGLGVQTGLRHTEADRFRRSNMRLQEGVDARQNEICELKQQLDELERSVQRFRAQEEERKAEGATIKGANAMRLELQEMKNAQSLRELLRQTAVAKHKEFVQRLKDENTVAIEERNTALAELEKAQKVLKRTTL